MRLRFVVMIGLVTLFISSCINKANTSPLTENEIMVTMTPIEGSTTQAPTEMAVSTVEITATKTAVPTPNLVSTITPPAPSGKLKFDVKKYLRMLKPGARNSGMIGDDIPKDNIYFEYDSSIWYETGYPSLSDYGILKNRNNPECWIKLAGYGGGRDGAPNQEETININSNHWILKWGIYYILPNLISLDVNSYRCEKDVENVLAKIFVNGKLLSNSGMDCSGVLPTRLKIGDIGQTTQNVNFRSKPLIDPNTYMFTLPAQVQVQIVEGPVCASYGSAAYMMWRVSTRYKKTEYSGWVAETNKKSYFIQK